MTKYLVMLSVVIVLSACSPAEDVLENVGDVSVPDQLSGCVARDGETCVKAACVADEASDCKSWVRACKKHGHIADVRDGHDTCERKLEEPGS